MKKIIIVASFFLSYCSISHRNNYFEMPVLEKIAQLSSIEPPPEVITFTPVYIIGINDSIVKSSFVKLRGVYKVSYMNKYIKFSDFLFDVLNQKITIDSKSPDTYFYYSQTFLLDSTIIRDYKEKGLEGIMEKYCQNKDGFFALNRGTLSPNKINSISYYFFVNQYIRSDDDYDASINFEKLSLALKQYY